MGGQEPTAGRAGRVGGALMSQVGRYYRTLPQLPVARGTKFKEARASLQTQTYLNV